MNSETRQSQKKLTAGLLMLCLLLLGAVSALADQNTALMHVNAKVAAFAEYNVLDQKNSLVVTQEDLEKGYVDVQGAMALSVRTNSANGYLLVLSVNSSMFSSVEMKDGSSSYLVSATGGEVHMPNGGTGPVTKQLDFRFHLVKNARPGTYGFPVALMVQPM